MTMGKRSGETKPYQVEPAPWRVPGNSWRWYLAIDVANWLGVGTEFMLTELFARVNRAGETMPPLQVQLLEPYGKMLEGPATICDDEVPYFAEIVQDNRRRGITFLHQQNFLIPAGWLDTAANFLAAQQATYKQELPNGTKTPEYLRLFERVGPKVNATYGQLQGFCCYYRSESDEHEGKVNYVRICNPERPCTFHQHLLKKRT